MSPGIAQNLGVTKVMIKQQIFNALHPAWGILEVMVGVNGTSRD